MNTAPAPAPQPATPRNPAEKLLVWGGIGILLIIVAIEGRAKLGYDGSVAALTAAVEADENELTFDAAQGLMRLGPTRSGPREEKNLKVYDFSWFSLFKPGQYVITMHVDDNAEKDANGNAVAHMIKFVTVAPPEEEEPDVPIEPDSPSDAYDSSAYGGGGGGTGGAGAGMGGGGGGAPGGGGARRPNPVREALDLDGDGTLSAEELAKAAESLAKLDQDGDGALAAAEMAPPPREDAGGSPGGGAPGGGGGPGGGQPPVNRLIAAIDKDGDGNLSQEELLAATASLLTLDEDGDGQLAADEIRPPRPAGGGPGGGGPGGAGGGAPRRPPAEETAPAADSQPAAEPATESAPAAAPATADPETPAATDAPASESTETTPPADQQ